MIVKRCYFYHFSIKLPGKIHTPAEKRGGKRQNSDEEGRTETLPQKLENRLTAMSQGFESLPLRQQTDPAIFTPGLFCIFATSGDELRSGQLRKIYSFPAE